MLKKITYNDWYNGKFIYKFCEIIVPDKSTKKIKTFEWKDMSVGDANKVREKQRELYFEACKNLSEIWKTDFKNRLAMYENKSKYIENEMNDLLAILSVDKDLNITHQEKPFLNHKSLVFEFGVLDAVRDYFHDEILLKKDRTFDFIHSPYCKFQHPSKTLPQIYAQVAWDVYDWLGKIVAADNIDKTLNENQGNPDTNNNKGPDASISPLLQLFQNTVADANLICQAMHHLKITKDSTDRQITAFIDAAKSANKMPQHKNNKLIRIIYSEIGKPIPESLRSRADGLAYDEMKKNAESYFKRLK